MAAPAEPDPTISALAEALVTIGCPADRSIEMARQLDKRAHQLSVEKGRSYEAAMAHLLGLMRQGWAGQQRRP